MLTNFYKGLGYRLTPSGSVPVIPLLARPNEPLLRNIDDRKYHLPPLFLLLYLTLFCRPCLQRKFMRRYDRIYRDIDSLSGAGIPIYTEAGRKGGIRLMNDFVLDKAVLSEKEKQEILTALQSINITQNLKGSQTLQKLSALFHLGSENWLEVDFSRWGNEKFDNKKLELLKSAVIHCQTIKIHYASSYEILSERIVQPHKLVYKAKAWYLIAFCTEKQDFRTFKLNRILDVEFLDESFQHRSFLKTPDAPLEEFHEITLRFPKEMAYRVYDEFDHTQVI